MSSSSGSRKRPQRHQNTSAWKSDKHKTDPKTKLVKSLVVTNCCDKCTSVIQWKIDYGKYKPLKQPTTCNKCSEKRVKSAYQTICVPCVDRLKVCAKCGVDVKHETITTSNSPNETILLAQIQVEVRRLPERKRRAFLRYLQKAEQALQDPKLKEGSTDQVDTVVSVRQDALAKLKELVLAYGKGQFEDDCNLLYEDLDELDLSEDQGIDSKEEAE